MHQHHRHYPRIIKDGARMDHMMVEISTAKSTRQVRVDRRRLLHCPIALGHRRPPTSRNHVKIAVTVHVGEINRFSIGSIRDNIGRRPSMGWLLHCPLGHRHRRPSTTMLKRCRGWHKCGPYLRLAETATAVRPVLAEVHDGCVVLRRCSIAQAMVWSRPDAHKRAMSRSQEWSAPMSRAIAICTCGNINRRCRWGAAAPSFLPKSPQGIIAPTMRKRCQESPSSSMSALCTSFAPCALVAMSAAVHDGSAAPSSVVVLSSNNAETISRSPSSSMSATAEHEHRPRWQYRWPSTSLNRRFPPNVILPSCPSELSVFDAETISKSPSPSKSAT